MDLVLEDDSHIGAAYFMISEENVAQQVQLPWMSFGSDAKSQKPEGVFLKSNTHPRAYGNFARLLGRYVREQKLISLQEAVRRLTSFPAENLKFEQPHQYSTGVSHVLVNGVLVLKDGEHTGATPGRFLRGPGSKPK
jgi:N-acyl-D-amino-acid deacylase